jgi:hypothetical protein
MQARLLQFLQRVETLSLREQVMVLLGIPLALVVAGEFLLFAPARTTAAEAIKLADRLESDVKTLGAVLAAQPAVASLPAADQLLRQRNELQAQIDAGRAVMASVNQSVDWGTVVRATVAGTPGLTLTQLKTMPAEVVFSPSMVKPASAPAAGRGASAATPAAPVARVAAAPASMAARAGGTGDTIYRHRADMTITGNFGTLLGYLQTLQRVPGDLHWTRLQLSVAGYPQATAQLTLYTLSTRAETPFN